MNTRRLDAEQIRDAMLAVSGELEPGRRPRAPRRPTPRRIDLHQGHPQHPRPAARAFDAPETFGSVPERNGTTTPTQSLLMINGDWPLKRAAAFAARVRRSEDG